MTFWENDSVASFDVDFCNDGQPLLEGSDWYIPAKVKLVGDELHYFGIGGYQDDDGNLVERAKVREQAGILSRFLALVDAPDVDIERFAQEWGVLELCEHGFPSTHRYRETLLPPLHADDPPWDCLEPCPHLYTVDSEVVHPPGIPVYRETLHAWRRWAREARAMLRISHRLYDNQPGDVADWRDVHSFGEAFHEWRDPVDGQPPGYKLGIDQLLLSMLAQSWIESTPIRLSWWWDWGAHRPKLSLTGNSLFACLTIQLLQAMAHTDGFEICSACGRPYAPERRPSPTRRHYCRDCRASGAPQRDAQRDRRRGVSRPRATSRRPLDATAK